MSAGAVTISIDLELAWGNWDNLKPSQARRVDLLERPVCARLIALLDRFDIPATWAVVAASLDPAEAQGRPGPTSIWYAPDIIDSVRTAKAAHDIGSQGGRHVYFDRISAAKAQADLLFARGTHSRLGLPFTSFVFPRNSIAHLELLTQAGLSVFRGQDRAWHQRLRGRHRFAGRIAHLLDKALPLAPEAVQPHTAQGLTDLPGSMLLLGRDGLRRLISNAAIASKLTRGLDAAQASGGVFHLWFHPSNFYHRADDQFALLAGFLAEAARRREAGTIRVMPMSAFAPASL